MLDIDSPSYDHIGSVRSRHVKAQSYQYLRGCCGYVQSRGRRHCQSLTNLSFVPTNWRRRWSPHPQEAANGSWVRNSSFNHSASCQPRTYTSIVIKRSVGFVSPSSMGWIASLHGRLGSNGRLEVIIGTRLPTGDQVTDCCPLAKHL